MYTYKFRIYPTKSQQTLLSKHFGCSRFVYNYFLNRRNEIYQQTKKGSTYVKDCLELTKVKKEFEWLSEVNSQSLQAGLKNLDSAYKHFFAKRHNFPKFKSRKSKQSYKIPQSIKIDNDKTYLPKFREGIKTIFHREVQGRIISGHVTRNKSGQYFISLLTDYNKPKPKGRKSKSKIGIDLGIKTFVTTSSGIKFEMPKVYRKFKNQIAKYQRRLSNSHNKRDQKVLCLLYRKCSNIREDFLHKLTLQLVRENQTIIVEDLSVKEILSNKFIADDMQDCPFGQFITILQYKCDLYNRQFIKINKWYPSSKTCNHCGNINTELQLSQREWQCPSCKKILDRDLNAAKNILTVGLHGLTKA